MGLSVRAASASASGPQAHQWTGFSRCWSRYGLVSRARRFSLMLRRPVGGELRSYLSSGGEGAGACQRRRVLVPPRVRMILCHGRACLPSAQVEGPDPPAVSELGVGWELDPRDKPEDDLGRL